MRVCLVSGNADLLQQLLECGAIEIVCVRPEEEIPEADLYIWEVEPPSEILQQLAHWDAAQHLLIVNSECHALRPSLPDNACILLRPVTANTLQALVSFALRTCRERNEVLRLSNARNEKDDPLLESIREITSKLQLCDPQREKIIERAVHDFRSSLAALNGYCGLLFDELSNRDEVQQADLLRRMRYSLNRLGRLSVDILYLLVLGSRRKAEDLSINNVENSLDKALLIVHQLLEEKHISVNVGLERPLVPFEPDQLERLFIYLLENSCKFTPEGGIIDIKGYPVQKERPSNEWKRLMNGSSGPVDAYRIDIIDSGKGISLESADTLFDLYTWAPETRQGSGLGLAISKSIINAHAGSIWAIPREHGGQISFVLPLHQEKGGRRQEFASSASSLHLR